MALEYQLIEINCNENEEKLSENKKKIMDYEIFIEKLSEKYKKLCIEHQIDYLEEINFNNSEIKSISTKENSQSKYNCNENKFDLSINENIEKGFQRISMKLMNSCDKLKPFNDLITDDLKNNDKIALIFDKAKTIILNLAIQV